MEAYERMKALVGEIDDDIRYILLDSAAEEIKNFCNIDEVPDELTGLQVEMAIRKYNRLGNEGETARTQGGISRTFTDEGITDADKRRMYKFRKMVLQP